MSQTIRKSIQKNIRVTPEQWNRIERTARDRGISPNRLIVDLVIEALDHGEWPRTEAEIRVARASLFTAQAIARDLISSGREGDVREIRKLISTIVPEPGTESGAGNSD